MCVCDAIEVSMSRTARARYLRSGTAPHDARRDASRISFKIKFKSNEKPSHEKTHIYMYTITSLILSTVDAHGPGPGHGHARHHRVWPLRPRSSPAPLEALQHANRPLINLVQIHRSSRLGRYRSSSCSLCTQRYRRRCRCCCCHTGRSRGRHASWGVLRIHRRGRPAGWPPGSAHQCYHSVQRLDTHLDCVQEVRERRTAYQRVPLHGMLQQAPIRSEHAHRADDEKHGNEGGVPPRH
jgi:hypothetical protein